MYGSVDQVLDQNAAMFIQLEVLNNSHQLLKKGILMIGEYRQVQEGDNTGLTTDKSQLRNELVRSVLQVSAALKAYALTVNNNELKVKGDYGISDLVRSSDPILLDIAVLLSGLAAPLKGELPKFFVGEKELNELNELIAAFKIAIPKRRVAASTTKVSTVNIREVFNAQDLLLREQIDVLMQPFKFTQSDFYNAYRNARLIVDYAGRTRATAEVSTAG